MPPRAMIYCHECHTEGFSLIQNNSPVCPSCSGTFIEEIATAQQGIAQDRADLDAEEQEGDGELPEGELEFNLEGLEDDNGLMGARIFHGPGVTLIQANTGGGGGGARVNVANNPLGAILQAFGVIPRVPAQGVDIENEVDDPDDMPIIGSQEVRQEGVRAAQNQVPIRNLASFLNNAFAAPPHHADHPFNNPYAEDGAPPPNEVERAAEAAQRHQEALNQAREEARNLQSESWERDHPGVRNPHLAFNAGPFVLAGGGGVGGNRLAQPNPNQSPMNYLVSLINSIGGSLGGELFGAGGERRANLGDYAFGDAGFASILNDLMEQAQGRAGPQPATPEIIAALPRTIVTPTLLDVPSIPDCPICQENLVLQEELITLPCSHRYHSECVETWLKTSGTCPSCRYALVPQTGDTGGANDPVGTPGAANVDPVAHAEAHARAAAQAQAHHQAHMNATPPHPQPHPQPAVVPTPAAAPAGANPPPPLPLQTNTTTSSSSTTTTRRSNPLDPHSPLITTTVTTTSRNNPDNNTNINTSTTVNTSRASSSTTSSRTTVRNHLTGEVVTLPGTFPGDGDGDVIMEEID